MFIFICGTERTVELFLFWNSNIFNYVLVLKLNSYLVITVSSVRGIILFYFLNGFVRFIQLCPSSQLENMAVSDVYISAHRGHSSKSLTWLYFRPQ